MGDSDYELVYYWVEECAALFAYGSYYEFFERTTEHRTVGGRAKFRTVVFCTISTAKKWTRARRK